MPDERRFGRRADGPTGRRRAVRERVDLNVSLYSVDQSRVALLIDVSKVGCRLGGSGLPPVGRDVLVKLGGIELYGQIVWKGDCERGVVFDVPMNDADVEDLRVALARARGTDLAGPNIISPGGRRKE